jgi:dienelactone hydrolase
MDKTLPGTALLTAPGDLASELVAGVDRFLLRQTELSVERRAQHWTRDFSSAQNYEQSLTPNRKRLAHILGARDDRVVAPLLQSSSPIGTCTCVATHGGFDVQAVRWEAFGQVHGEGLLLTPRHGLAVADVVALPDADQTPEQIAGLTEGVPVESQFGRILAASGCRVLIPQLINRKLAKRQSPNGGWAATLSNREYVYRPAFVLGRHILGYETQKLLAGVDWLVQNQSSSAISPDAQRADSKPATSPGKPLKIGVIGWGEGGLLALCAGALDPRIDAVGVSGYFSSRQNLWQEPVDRNVFGWLAQFGDAELAGMIAPRALIIEAARGPQVEIPPGLGGAPGRLKTPALDKVQSEFQRALRLVAGFASAPPWALVVSGQGAGPYFQPETGAKFLQALAPNAALTGANTNDLVVLHRENVEVRHQRQLEELDRHTQALLVESPYVRMKFMAQLDTRSPADYERTAQVYRDVLYTEIIGKIDEPVRPANPRSRRVYDRPKWTGYEVVLDVFPDVMAYGILLVPKTMTATEKRPVVVCQHGLEGRPQQIIEGNHEAYHDFAAKLAEEGFITFAPQNLYLFGDRFRSLQRKANPLQLTLFSIITAQHQQILNWLKQLPFVDAKRIGFYGLSYGGKTAMRVPALLNDYCLSICSADFNDWVWKNASTRSPYSYVWSGEYEIFEFDLGSTFNYAEMAALIAPRPFMVERGHYDGVAPDETVAYEFAKVRHLYAAKLGLGDRCAIEWFVGPHTIHGQGTYAFLHQQLQWPTQPEQPPRK